MDHYSLAVGFLVGAVTGATGTYLGNKYTDQRKVKEKAKANQILLVSLWAEHKKLLSEMRDDLRKPDFKYHREFVVTSRVRNFNNQGKALGYYVEDHDSLEQQINILVSKKVIFDVGETGKYSERYRFSDLLIEYLSTK